MTTTYTHRASVLVLLYLTVAYAAVEWSPLALAVWAVGAPVVFLLATRRTAVRRG